MMAEQRNSDDYGAWHGEIRMQEPMSRHTSWRIGGNADRFFRPANKSELVAFLTHLPADESLTWIGLGSNLLVRDGGIRGTVINTRGTIKEMRLLENSRVYVEAGVACAHVARFCGEHNLVGAEFLAGIPGTMGGALMMNAGAFGGETWSLVESVQVVNRCGQLRELPADQFEVGYRSVAGLGNDQWFIACHLQLQKGDGQQSQLRIRQLLAERNNKQPTNQPSCGSVFRNPPGDYAARLIEACGLKGLQIGDAQISEKHANFIVNLGHASSKDIESLIELIQKTVKQQFAIELHPEVKVIGDSLEDAR